MLFDPSNYRFYLSNEKILDFDTMAWVSTNIAPTQLIEISDTDAVLKLQTSAHKIRVPIGVIGANNPNQEQYHVAENLGKALAKLNLYVICGGRFGIMEAVCKGVEESGGISIGMLPEPSLVNANKFATIAVATGIGLARNLIIATSALCLIAVGGSYGTLSEIAYGLQLGKQVFTINSSLNVDGAVSCETIEEVIENVCKVIFKIS